MKEMVALKPDANPKETCEIFHRWMEIRVDDLNEVMDVYLEDNKDAKFIVIGHSLGGSEAYVMVRYNVMMQERN